MIIFLLAILSMNSAFQGEIVNITLSEPAIVYLDSCMFFEHNLGSSDNLSVGTYGIVIGYNCEGLKAIVVKTDYEERLTIEVKRLANFSEEVYKMQKEFFALKKENENLKSRVSYLQSLVEIINSINVDLYDKIKEYSEKNMRLSQELEVAKMEIQNYSKTVIQMNLEINNLQLRISELEKKNSELENEVQSAKSYLQNSIFYAELFKNATILLIAIVVGIFLSFLRRY
ncbi:MAG: hypothetical protein QXR27_04115 [Archaeoglobaceae archaeon]